jgi:hypothetical protein
MRRIINGKAYDTDTAEFIAGRSEGHGGDFRYLKEDLYRTDKGTWFLSGSGGAATKYRQPVDFNGWTGGSGVLALTTDEARDWLEAYANDLVEEYFEVGEA